MRITPIAAFLLLAGSALAEEPALRPGPGQQLVAENCGSCHSLNYIRMNSPFLDQAGWTAEVNKMVNVFHAPVEAAAVPEIIAYLAREYGPPR